MRKVTKTAVMERCFYLSQNPKKSIPVTVTQFDSRFLPFFFKPGRQVAGLDLTVDLLLQKKLYYLTRLRVFHLSDHDVLCDSNGLHPTGCFHSLCDHHWSTRPDPTRVFTKTHHCSSPFVTIVVVLYVL